MQEVWQSLPASRILEDALEDTCLLESRLCEECGKTFSCQACFQTHLKMHSGAKPHTCAECGRAFGLSVPLHIHARTRTGGSPMSASRVGKPSCLSLPSEDTWKFMLDRTFEGPLMGCGLVVGCGTSPGSWAQPKNTTGVKNVFW